MFTDKPDALFAAWERPGPAVLISEAKKAVRGGSAIVGVVFFVGCARNEHGNCNSVVNFKVLGPDNKPWGTPLSGGELWIDKPPPPESDMQLSIGNIGIVIEPKDSLGTYSVTAEVLDKISGKRLVLERKLDAVEGK